MRTSLSLFFIFLTFLVYAQSETQVVRGKVVDQISRQPLPGANVFLRLSDEELRGSTTDLQGEFRIADVPVGRHIIYCQYIGYDNWASGNLEITSAKETYIEIPLAESAYTTQEVVVVGKRLEDQPNNEFAIMSTRPFTMDETQRYAGSINDPGRMAMSLPGVQMAQQDNESTIVVKGNSPVGVLWRLEGVDIPNPNHFAETNGSGGGISALSIFVLGNSDFLTAAYPAEYGNAFSGIMDMRFRKGNTQSREYRVQAGMIGLDLATEGPFGNKKNSGSYLVNYRYSTLGLLNQIGLRIVNPDVENVFQDLSFNLYFPLGSKTSLTVFGLGGLSSEVKTAKENPDSWERWNDYRTYDFDTDLGMAGITLTRLLDDRSSMRLVLMHGINDINWEEDTVTTAGEPFRWVTERVRSTRTALNASYQRKIRTGSALKAGFTLTRLGYDLFSSEYRCRSGNDITVYAGKGSSFLLQPYLQYSALFSRSFRLNAGLHSMYFGLTGDAVLEPRLGLEWYAGSSTTFTAAYGLHSQILPWPTYFTTIDTGADVTTLPNTDLGFIRAHHAGVGINHLFAGNLRLKVEPYYQYLFDVPTSINPNSTYSVINQNEFYEPDTLANSGNGRNYGVELTFEKFFSNQLFFLLSGALYQSQFKTNNGGPDVWYHTRWASIFNTTFTAGKEWQLSRDRLLEVGGRFLFGGGQRYTPIDTDASSSQCRAVEEQYDAYTQQTPNYFRTDLRISFRKNRSDYAWKLSLDIQNLTNRVNPKRPVYDPLQNTIIFDPNSGIIPVISYTVDF